jgi:hypothetical protein
VKDLIKVRHFVNDAANEVIDLSDPNKLVAVDATKSCFDLYKVIGTTFWVNTECMSTAKEGYPPNESFTVVMGFTSLQASV